MVVYRGMDGGEFLQGLDISESRHCALSSSGRLVRVLGSIVEPTAARLIGGITDYIHRGPVGAKPVGYDRSRPAVTLHRPLQELHRSPAIPALRRKYLEHLSFVINCPPQVMRLATDPDEHLIQVPAPL